MLHEAGEILHRITNIEETMSDIQAQITALVDTIDTAVTTLTNEAGDLTPVDLTGLTTAVDALVAAVAALVPAPSPSSPPVDPPAGG